MPIYEFYCPDCNTIFSFFSRGVNTTGRPPCPKCRGKKLTRQISGFAVTGRKSGKGDAAGEDPMADLPIDESKMERAMESLASEAEGISEDDPRQAARLMRKFSSMTGLEFNEQMETAISRMENGEDPEKVEADMGDVMEKEDPFVLPGKKGKPRAAGRRPPSRDSKLYEM